MRSSIAACAVLLAGAFGFAGAASAQFYADKTVTMLVNYPAGGPSDIEARVVARFLGDHIPGKPTVIVKNMPGAGGLIATNYMGEIVPDDATQLAFFTWNPMTQILSDPGLRVGYDKFQMVAGFEQPAIVYVRKDVAPGMEKPQDLLKAGSFKVGALAPNTHTTLRVGLALDLLGLDFEMVSGYRGLKDVETAVLQNEVQAAASSIAGYRGSIEPTMVKDGVVIPAFHFDVEDANGKLGPSPAFSEVPTFLQLYREKNGSDAMPSGEKWESLRLISSIMDSVYRTVFLPPKASSEAVADMRKAFEELQSDQAFVEAYTKTVGTPPGIVSGAQAEKVVRQLGTVDPAVSRFLAGYVQELSKN